MAAGLGDFLQFSVHQSYLDQNIYNVYHYRVTSLTGLAGDYLDVLNDWLDDNVNAMVRVIQNTAVNYIDIEARNLTNGVDVAIMNLSSTGAVAATIATRAPSWLSFSFRLLRETLTTRHGWKRYCGGNEGQFEQNSWTIAGTDTTNIENAISSDIVLGLVTVCEPVILKRPLPTPVPTSHPYSSIGGAIFRTLIGSQGSRKVGIGI